MAKKKSQKQRAKEMLEALGWTVADVEKHLRHTFVTQDLFGFADLLCLKEPFTLALQVTRDRDVSTRVKKMLAEPRLKHCLQCGWLVEAWGVRDEAALDGSMVVSRVLEISEDGKRIVAFEGSDVLDWI